MCLYMSVPLWINVERLTTAVSATASQLFDVSLVIFLLNCKSTAVVARTSQAATAKAAEATKNSLPSSSVSPAQLSVLSTTTATTTTTTSLNAARHKCKQLKQRLHQQTQINPLAATTNKNLIDLTPTITKTFTSASTKSFLEPADKIQYSAVSAHNINDIIILDDAGV